MVKKEKEKTMSEKEKKLNNFELFLESHGLVSVYAEWIKGGGPKRARYWVEGRKGKKTK